MLQFPLRIQDCPPQASRIILEAKKFLEPLYSFCAHTQSSSCEYGTPHIQEHLLPMELSENDYYNTLFMLQTPHDGFVPYSQSNHATDTPQRGTTHGTPYIALNEVLLKRDVRCTTSAPLFIVACSGGSDSLCLLFILWYLRPMLQHSILLLYLQHGLREESLKEEHYVRSFSFLLGIPYHSYVLSVKTYATEYKVGLEESGRILRYTAFHHMQQQYPNAYIALGHHADDLAEDVCMRLIRGTSLDKLCAMPLYETQRRIIRPLLYFAKKDLTSFLTAIGVPWMEDASNYTDQFLRSRIRNTIIPFCKQENPKFLAHITTLHMQTVYDTLYWNNVLSPSHTYDELPTTLLKKMHIAARIRLYKTCLEYRSISINSAKLYAIDTLWRTAKKGRIVLNKSYDVHVSKKGIRFIKKDRE